MVAFWKLGSCFIWGTIWRAAQWEDSAQTFRMVMYAGFVISYIQTCRTSLAYPKHHTGQRKNMTIVSKKLKRISASKQSGTNDAQSIIVSLVACGKVSVSKYNDALSNLRGQGRDKPLPVNVKHDKLTGKALAVAAHIQVIPLILSSILPENEESDLLDLLFMLHKINEYILADCFTLADVFNFQASWYFVCYDQCCGFG